MSSPANPGTLAAEAARRRADERRDKILAPYQDAMNDVQHLYDAFASTVTKEETAAVLTLCTIMLTPIEDA